MSLAYAFSFSPKVSAEVRIISLDPSSGEVGASVQLTANITKENGPYEILFNSSLVASGNASGYWVNASFTVPEISGGNHSITIVDVTTEENNSRVFTVYTFYTLQVVVPRVPLQLQENDTVPIYLNMTGGDSSSPYVANITVQNPGGIAFVKMLTYETSPSGTANVALNYPNDFEGGATTNFVGNYMVFFNDTLELDTFFVGLTNSTEYHRSDVVDIRAAYMPYENVSITIAGKDILSSLNVTADSNGIVNYSNWTVPLNASVGTYNASIVSVSPSPTIKYPPDIQDFTVPGYAVNVTAKNLAGDPVPSVEIRAFADGQSLANATTGSTGLVTIKLETGNYTLGAYSKDQKVGELEPEIANVTSIDLACNLTNLRVRTIAVVDGIEIGVPEAGIFITPENKTVNTDITGTSVARSLLPNTSYTLNVSRYNMPFNITVIPDLLVDSSLVAWYDVTIFCPEKRLEVTVSKADGSSFNDAIVKIQERLGGIEYEGNTDASGAVTFTAVFGRYDVRVYDTSGIRLNETAVDLFEDQSVSVHCSLYGLEFSVKVVDYFGQPISGVTVTLRRDGSSPVSDKTEGEGTVTFGSLIGGNIEVAVYIGDQSEPTAAQGLTISNSTSTQIKIGKYTVLLGLLVETGQFAVALIIVSIVVVILLLEVYRTRRVRIQKSES